VSPVTEGSWQGQYALVTLHSGAGFAKPTVTLTLGPMPVGPCDTSWPIDCRPEPDDGNGINAYNAKAHPHLPQPGSLLVHYNVTTPRWEEHLQHADIYRPRFLICRWVGDRETFSVRP
jgi:hypothetical protein